MNEKMMMDNELDNVSGGVENVTTSQFNPRSLIC